MLFRSAWRRLWKQKVPHKIQIFGWRALHGIIPLKCILANRHIGTSGECPICHLAAEDVKHLLFDCQPAVELWNNLGVREIITAKSQLERSGSVILEDLLNLEENSLSVMPSLGFKEVLFTGCWYLWWMRRQVTHDEPIPPAWKWSMSVLAIANNYKKSLEPKSMNSMERWDKSEPRSIKLNVDAAFYADNCAGATAAVLRDERGSFIAAQCIYVEQGLNAVTLEAVAMRDGLMLANSMGFHDVEAESDSLEVINFCTGPNSMVGCGCSNIRATSIGKVKFIHGFSAANAVTHELARYRITNKNSVSWLNDPPGWLISTLVHDVSVDF